MKLTHKQLRKMILQELRVSIGAPLEEITSDVDLEDPNPVVPADDGSQEDGGNEEGGMDSIAEENGGDPVDEAIRLVEALREEIVAENTNTALQNLDALWDLLQTMSPSGWGGRGPESGTEEY